MKSFPKRLRHGSGKTMTLDESRVMIVYKRDRSPARVDADLKPDELVCEAAARLQEKRAEEQETEKRRGRKKLRRTKGAVDAPLPVVNDTPRRFIARRSDRKKLSPDLVDRLQKRLEARVDHIAPVYRIAGTEGDAGLVCPLRDVVLVKPVADLSESAATTMVRHLVQLGLEEVAEKSKYLRGFRYFRVKDPRKKDAYALVASIKRLSAVADARFENMPLIKPVAFVPNDTFYTNQWNMPQIDAEEAWDLTTGHSSVVVAVADTGCDLTHPDLAFASNGVNLGTMSGTGAPVGAALFNGHGTCCAGIISAALDNGQGIAGLAGQCRILPIAFVNWTDAEVAASITYAADNGATVLSMSFGQYDTTDGVAPSGWDFDVIDPAIEDAHGRALVLCAATGNEDINTFNRYPARHDLVIAVGGSSTDDNRKTTTSPDGETWWGANWADGMSVVAPCVLVPTTDIQGNGGYNTSGGAAGDYFQTFNGTSSATPHVSALAALCLSTNTFLDNEDVRYVIETNAEKVGTTAYSTQAGYPNGTRNQAMGYGRINARDTVDDASMLFVEQYNLLFG